ncbi:hypothetical protein WR25_07553 [Diploscapter pachys]|uniref:G-protein coupled receptors family 1 profile domain-containing protein n=1 Tax=Diploscapter pachys TaxID=2018661 RepID=A0A2A2JRK3_9BILA|nr:hypothetical protein WR25_07553 [Diploscapter pachys]
MGSCELGSIDLNGALWLEEVIHSVHTVFANIHPYLAVALCIAVNSLLCAVAFCDMIVMISVFAFIMHFFINIDDSCDPSMFSKGWALFLFAHSQVTVILHATSIWLTVLLAQIRVYTIRRATSMPSEGLSISVTLLIALITFGVVLLINIPNFRAFEIIEMDAAALCAENSTMPEPQVIYNVIAPTEKCNLVRLSLWLNGILFKMCPCVMLTVSIVALLKIIREVSHRRKTLAQVMHKKRMPRDNTTPMLVAVLSIFLLTELPQGILHVGNAAFSRDTFYTPLLFSCVPSSVHKRFMADLEFADLERSHIRPSNMTTDMTRT